ncbi:endonuclease dU [Candidatus Pyrohabitans sp.]
MALHFFKRGLRALGIAESFVKQRNRAVLAGVVMRGDLQVDGFGFAEVTLRGLDATQGVIDIYRQLGRRDINLIMLNGCIISLFNLIDLDRVYETLARPVICVTYEESSGLEKYLREFSDAEARLEIYRRLGGRSELKLNTGYRVFVRYRGLEPHEVRHALNLFTLQGSVPEPLRVARLLARAVLRWRSGAL